MSKSIWKLSLAIVLAFGFIVAGSAAAQYPQLQGRVNDYAEVLQSDTVAALEQKLEQYDRETSNEIVVVIVPDLGGLDIDTYRNELFAEWKIGKADKDNGVLLVVAMAERDVGIEVGYGLEGALTDGTAGAIIRNEITPLFKQDNYDAGVTAGVDSIMAATRGEYVAETATNNDEWIGWIVFLVFIFGFFVLSNFSRRQQRVWDPRKQRWVSRRSNSSGWWLGGGGGFSGGGGSSGGGGASGGW